jgi:hypothetical protein
MSAPTEGGAGPRTAGSGSAPTDPRALQARAAVAALTARLEARARAANTVAELGFSIANDSFDLLPFRQTLVFEGDGPDAALLAVSGLARPTEDSPYLIWLRRTWPWLHGQASQKPGWVAQPDAAPDLPPGMLDGWLEWWPQGALVLPLQRRSGERLGWLVMLLDQRPQAEQAQALQQVLETWSYCWEMLAGKPKPPWRSRWSRLGKTRRSLLALAVLLVLLIPVRQTSLAPAEVIALDAETMAAPMDGVVKTIHVRPNATVKKGQVLFSLDDTTLRNRLDVVQKSVAVADAELQSATQKAFDSFQSKGDLSLLNGKLNEKRAELESVRAQLQRIDVVAERDGVAVFGDPNDWLGRPVSTGERIMQLADPAKPGLLMYLPVAEAIALEPGAPVRLFLTVLPLSPLDATITESSFQVVLSPDGVASYRLRGQFDDDPNQEGERAVRIGLRGTAKIYGDRVLLGYYLFRRPLATLREWTGW